MSAGYLLDTNTLSYIASGRSLASRAEFMRLRKDPEVRFWLSVITEAEVRYGMAKNNLSPRRRAVMEGLFANFDILPWGSKEAAVYAFALPKLQARGIAISILDFMIASHAAAHDAILVTHDGVFSRVQEITGIHSVVDWAIDL